MGTTWRVARVASCTRRLKKRGSLATKSASGRRPTKLAKAASISRRVLALTISISSPIARAAGSASRSVISAVRLTGLTITATRATDGTNSRRSSSCFAVNSPLTLLTPVRLPPGRARLATRPSLTGSSLRRDTMGMLAVAAFAGRAAGVFTAITFTRCRTKSAASSGSRSKLILTPAVHDRDVFSFDKASILQAPMECAQAVRECLRRRAVEEAYGRHRRLLRARRERPRGNRAAEEGDEVAALHVAPLSWQLAQQPLSNPYDVVFAVV